jgi:hypothetical protein
VGSPARRTWTLALLDRRALHALWFDIETRRWEAVPWPTPLTADDLAAADAGEPAPQRSEDGAPTPAAPEPEPGYWDWIAERAATVGDEPFVTPPPDDDEDGVTGWS